MSNLIDFECPHCHGGFKFERSEFQARQIAGGYALGQMVPCPHCQGEVTVCLPIEPPIGKRNSHKPFVFAALGILLAVTLIVALKRVSEMDADSSKGLGSVILLCGVVFIYFIPTISGRHKKNATAIFMLNLFLGWTFIGWVVALVWACMKEDEVDNKMPLRP